MMGENIVLRCFIIKAEEIYEKVVKCRQHPWGSIREEFNFLTKRTTIQLNDANFQELVLNNRSEIVICVGTKEALSNPDAQQRIRDCFPHLSLIGMVDSTDPESVETAARFKANLGDSLGRASRPVETFIYDAGKHRFTMFYYIRAEEIYEKVIRCRQDPWASKGTNFMFIPNYNGRHSV
jgi:hypothetical protein